MIIVSDTTPLHYLIVIERAELLAELFGSIIIPEAVFAEMAHDKTPVIVQEWLTALPSWVQVKGASPSISAQVKNLGRGETEAIALALEHHADALLMDDRKAIREARKNNLVVLTTLAILELAAIKGLIDFPEVLHELAQTNFRLPSDEIVEAFLRRDQARKQLSDKTTD